MSPDILPDCRAKITRGRVFHMGANWVPVFCANCGTNGGLCPEENMTFAFYLCNECFAKHGAIAGTMAVPDQEFYSKVAQEQQESFGRALTHMELVQIVVEDSTPLARLLKEAR